MVDVAAIAGALNSLKIALDLTKGAVGVRDQNLLNDRLEGIRSKIWEAQEHALSAQQTISDLMDERRDLKDALAQCEDRRGDLERYELVELPSRSFAYRVKEVMRGSEPSHYACPNCMKAGKVAILQPGQWAYGRPHLTCRACKTEIDAE